MSTTRDVDLIIKRLAVDIPNLQVEQLRVLHPGADDDGLWLINTAEHEEQVQIESSSGNCPFLVESDFNEERFHAETVEEVVAAVKRLYGFA